MLYRYGTEGVNRGTVWGSGIENLKIGMALGGVMEIVKVHS